MHLTGDSSKYFKGLWGYSSEKFSKIKSLCGYTKGVPFLSKMVHKRLRVWIFTWGSTSLYKTLLSAPPNFKVNNTNQMQNEINCELQK